MPKVSIIIPVYNGGAYVSTSLDSVLSQSFSDYEIIIIDDGSTDKTSAVIKDFINTNPSFSVRYIYQENSGPAVARNRGIRESRGEYIAFLDVDDSWLPDKLEQQVEILDKKEARCGLIYTDYFLCDEEMRIKSIHRCPTLRQKQMERAFLLKNRISTPTLLIRKSCFDVVGLFDESLHVAEDWDMWLRIIKRFGFEHIPMPLVKVRVRKISQSSNAEKNLSNDLRFLDKIFSGLDMKSKLLLKKKAYSYRYYKAAIAYRENGDIDKMRDAILKSIKIYPFHIFNKSILLLFLKNFLR